MEKIKFTVQILVLVLAFPVWFFAEMTMADKSVKNVEVINSDSTQVKKAAMINIEKADENFDIKTASFSKLMVVYN